MAIKSILVHVANDPRHKDRLNFAVDLCRHVAGHLEVVFPVDPITMPAGAAGRAASNAFLAEARAITPKPCAKPSPINSRAATFPMNSKS